MSTWKAARYFASLFAFFLVVVSCTSGDASSGRTEADVTGDSASTAVATTIPSRTATPPAPATTRVTSTPTTAIVASTTSHVLPLVLEPGEFTIDVSFGGRDRQYLLHVPPIIVEPLMVIVSLHGGGGNAQQHKDDIALDPIADREGFVTVYPAGTGIGRFLTWNAGPHCCGRSVADGVDDVGFLDAVLADLSTRLDYERGRVVVAGHSNGAMMAARFAAETVLPVGAVVSVAGVEAPEVVPNRPVPRLHIHSVDDPRALYEGGKGPPFPVTGTTVTHFAVESVLDAWADANGCDPDPTESDAVVADGHSVTDVVWLGCEADLVHKRLTGAGHGWPGVDSPLVGLLGPSTEIIDASAEIWNFANAQLN